MDALISPACAAYIANVTDRQINRMVDESIGPPTLVSIEGNSRLFKPFYAALARFYYETEPIFQSSARREVMQKVASRLDALLVTDPGFDLALFEQTGSSILLVEVKGYAINVEPYVARTLVKAKEVDQADALVQASNDVMGGAPVFVGTRLPIDNVLTALAQGRSADDIVGEYPFLTPAHVDAAQVYNVVRPRRGRPPRLKDVHSSLSVKSTRTLRPSVHDIQTPD